MFFKDERDSDFFQVCEKVRSENKTLSVSEVAKIAVYLPAPSLYLTTRELAKIVNRIRKGEKCSTYKSAGMMYDQIEKMMIEIPGNEKLSAYEIARIIDAEPVPRFYMSEARARTIYYDCLKNIKKSDLPFSNELNCKGLSG